MIDEKDIPHVLTSTEVQSWEKVVNTLLFLRTEQGCNWDKAQTMESIIVNLVEEVSELIDAIHMYSHKKKDASVITDDNKQTQDLIEEFGDVQLVLTMMMIIFTDTNSTKNNNDTSSHFDMSTFNAIFVQLGNKLIRRHPHVFSHTVLNENKDDLYAQWQHIKYHVEGKREPETLHEYKPYLHILERVKEIQKKAEKLSLSQKQPFSSKLQKLQQSLEALTDAESSLPDKGSYIPIDDDIQLNIGKCFYELIDIARSLRVSPTTCLTKYMSTVLQELQHT